MLRTRSRRPQKPPGDVIEFLSCLLVQVGQVVDDVGILRSDLRIGPVFDQLLHRTLNGVAQLLIAGAEGNAVLLGAQLLVEDGGCETEKESAETG